VTSSGPASLRVVPTAELAADLRAQIIEVCNAANRTDAFHELFDLVPPDGRHVLALLDGEVVSHAVVTTRWLLPEGLPLLRTAFVDAVATRPDHQGSGHSTAVMARLGESIDDFEVGALQTDLRGFYERLGWRLWRGPLAGRVEDGELLPTPEQEGVMVLATALTPALDLEAPLSIERQPKRIWE
jgi:aminoglycoside 2'-N-acetyltransferase I